MKLYETMAARTVLANLYNGKQAVSWELLRKMKQFADDTQTHAEFWRDSVNRILREYQDKNSEIPSARLVEADDRIKKEIGGMEIPDNKPFSVNDFTEFKMTGTERELLLYICYDV